MNTSTSRTWPAAARAEGAGVAAPDREVLAFAAAHRFVRTDHAAALLGDSEQLARERLASLAAAGLLAHHLTLFEAKRTVSGSPGP